MRRIIFLFVGVMILVTLIATKFEFSDMTLIVSQKISWVFYILLCFLNLGQLLLRSLRFKLLCSGLSKSWISLLDSFLLTTASYFVTFATPMRIGDISRGLFLKSKRLEVTAISLIECTFDALILLLLPILGLFILYHTYITELVIGYTICLLALLILIVSFRFFNYRKILYKFKLYLKFEDKLKSFKDFLKEALKRRLALLFGFLFTCLFYGLLIIIFHIVLHKLRGQTTLLETAVSVGMGMVIGILSFVPMGLGTRDASTYGILVSLGTDPGIAISAVIIVRSLSLPIIIVSGFCYFISIRRFDVSQAE